MDGISLLSAREGVGCLSKPQYGQKYYQAIAPWGGEGGGVDGQFRSGERGGGGAILPISFFQVALLLLLCCYASHPTRPVSLPTPLTSSSAQKVVILPPSPGIVDDRGLMLSSASFPRAPLSPFLSWKHPLNLGPPPPPPIKLAAACLTTGGRRGRENQRPLKKPLTQDMLPSTFQTRKIKERERARTYYFFASPRTFSPSRSFHACFSIEGERGEPGH